MKIASLKGFATLILLTLFQTVLWAQENSGSGGGSTDAGSSTTSVTKTTTSTMTSDNFLAQPWVWVVGAAVFIIILIALLRGGSDRTVSKSDRVVVSKTRDV